MNLFDALFAADNGLDFDCLDRLPEAIYIYNTERELLYLNKAAEALDGFTLEYAKGKTIYELYDFVHGLDEKYSPTLITLETEKPMVDHRFSYVINGKRNVQISNSGPIYCEGKLVGVYVIQQDMTMLSDMMEENIALRQEVSRRKSNLPRESAFSGLIGESEAFSRCKALAEQVAVTSSSVMLVAETGCGKEVFARAIHEGSPRHNGSFLALNCAAIPESLIEGILFGTSKGVYTGAVEKEGLLARSDGGTLFLDEVNSMPLASQAKLLRVLEEKKVMKLGSNKEQTVDLRIISSMNEDPGSAVNKGHLREDLFYRLSVVQLWIPALRDRREDIPLLTSHFIEDFNRRFHKEVSGLEPEAAAYFQRFSWPGNVRQLKACIESAMNFSSDRGLIRLADLPRYLFDGEEDKEKRFRIWHQMRNEDNGFLQKESFVSNPESFDVAEAATRTELKHLLAKEECDRIMEALRQTGGNISQAASMLGISKQLLSYKLKKYKLK